MKSFLKTLAIVSALTLSVSGCGMDTSTAPSTTANNSNNGNAYGNSSTANTAGGREYTSFVTFKDIPMPSKTNIDLNRTLIMGDSTNWIGRLALSTPYKMNEMFDFYEKHMVEFRWASMSTMRATSSVLTFKQGNRIATIILTPSSMGGNTQVDFTISPENMQVNNNMDVEAEDEIAMEKQDTKKVKSAN